MTTNATKLTPEQHIALMVGQSVCCLHSYCTVHHHNPSGYCNGHIHYFIDRLRAENTGLRKALDATSGDPSQSPK